MYRLALSYRMAFFFYVDEKNVMKQYAAAVSAPTRSGIDPSCDGVREQGLVSCLFDGKHHTPWNNCEQTHPLPISKSRP